MVTSDNNSGLNELLVATANGLAPWPPPCVRDGAEEAQFTSIAAVMMRRKERNPVT
jgi:hypothetical protein